MWWEEAGGGRRFILWRVCFYGANVILLGVWIPQNICIQTDPCMLDLSEPLVYIQGKIVYMNTYNEQCLLFASFWSIKYSIESAENTF